jgi:hypothetical protein
VASALLVAALLLAVPLASNGDSSSVSLLPGAQSVIGAPGGIMLIGSSPGEAAGEAWGYTGRDSFALLRYTQASRSWQKLGPPVDREGHAVQGFGAAAGPLAGRATPAGGVAIVGHDSAGAEQVLVRDPGRSVAEEAPALSEAPSGKQAGAGALLKAGEKLAAPVGEGVLMAPVEVPGSDTGVFLVPFESAQGATQEDVLFYDGTGWTREPICVGVGAVSCSAPGAGFKVLAIDASSPQNAWLLAKGSSGSEGVVLFHRNPGASGGLRWEQSSLGSAGSLGARFAQAAPPVSEASVHVAALAHGQLLTVTAQGLWIDGQLTVSIAGQPSQQDGFTLYYKPGAAGASGEVLSSWCDVPAQAASLCKLELGSSLPRGDYRSFAWSEGGGPFGERVVTGLENGVSLSLHGESFVRVLGLGGESGTSRGAAFSSPQEGWLSEETGPLTHMTTEAEPDRVQPWPVPFRRPLTAIATQPGAGVGEMSSQAIAVGQDGQVARYTPGQGWGPESLLSSSGVAQTPDLRGVAWPEPGRAYAVGSSGAMWLWQSSTGLWEPDPARPPNLFLANFTGVAFDPSNPSRGYAIGQQGVLLGFGKTWTQEALPPGLEGADFTSIAFAGGEALVSYQLPNKESRTYSGGLIVNDGSGWRVDTEVATMADQLGVPVRVAGMSDGGAALATTQSTVLMRQGAGARWTSSPAGQTQGYPVALALIREATGTLRPVVSVDLSGFDDQSQQYAVDEELKQETPSGQAPIATTAYPLPGSGYLLRETATGWEDEEHGAYPLPSTGRGVSTGEVGFDWPVEPDAVLALALNPDGSQCWAVGGQTGEINENEERQAIESIQTAGVMRYPASGAAPPGFSVAPVQSTSANATFAIGGNAQCATACADLAGDQLGPDASLANAIVHAGPEQAPGVRAFLYTGAHVAPALSGVTDAAGFQREEQRYAELMSTSGGPPAVFAAPSESDLNAGGSLQNFESAFSSFGAPLGSGAEPPGIVPRSQAGTGAAYYSFSSNGTAGTVRVIVLDYSRSALGVTQQCWLAQQLAEARAERAPAIVIGNRELSTADESGDAASDSAQVIPTLVNGASPSGCPPLTLPAGGASAYFFDFPEQNRTYRLSSGGISIPAFGNGTLGYVRNAPQNDFQFLGAKGFLLAEVEVPGRNPQTGRANVTARLIPDISDLALDPANGTLLRRSQVSLFNALARAPRAGLLCQHQGPSCGFEPDPYVPIPSTCQGSTCATGILPDYTFTSSRPDIGNFVEPDPASAGGTTVLQGPEGKPIPDEHSGLFCAFNAGTTTVTVQAGGLSSSEQITVQAGSVEQPCGTVPLQNPPAAQQRASLPVPPPAPAPAPASAKPSSSFPPPPAPKPVIHVQPHPVLTPVPLAPAQLFPVLPLLPPPAPSVARPTPPSGGAQVPSQSPVSQSVGVEEREEEEQGATEAAHHMAVYEPHRPQGPMPAWPIALVLLAAAVGAASRRGPRQEMARVRAD